MHFHLQIAGSAFRNDSVLRSLGIRKLILQYLLDGKTCTYRYPAKAAILGLPQFHYSRKFTQHFKRLFLEVISFFPHEINHMHPELMVQCSTQLSYQFYN